MPPGNQPGRRRAFLAGATLLALAFGRWGDCLAQMDLQSAEYKVKAAFLYKFAGYIQWPAHAFPRSDAPLVIGVMGAEALREEVAAIVASRTVDGHPVTVQATHPGDPLGGLHMLFIGRAESGRYGGILAEARGKPVLTVSESDEAFALGSIINFVVVNDRVRFDVALAPAGAGHMKISARLLSVARKVIGSAS